MEYVTATWRGEELVIEFDACVGSDNCIHDISVSSIKLLSCDLPFDILPKALRDEIMEKAKEEEFR